MTYLTRFRIQLSILSIVMLMGLVLAACLYYPGKDGPLVLDDISSVSSNPYIRVSKASKTTFVDAVYSTNHVLHTDYSLPYRGLSYLSFALNYYFADNIMQEFKLTNVALHLFTGIIVFLLSRRLLLLAYGGAANQVTLDKTDTVGIVKLDIKSSSSNQNEMILSFLAVIIAMIWLLHPLYVSTVLYITQRMTILSGLFSLLTVYAFIDYRCRFLQTNKDFWRALVVLALGTLTAFLAKENGALVPLFCLVVELVFFRFAFHPQTSTVNKAVFLSLLLLPTIVVIVYLCDSWLGQLSREAVNRHFTVNERFMTQWRVLWQYVGHLTLLNEQGIHFYQDNIEISKSLLNPLSTLISLLAWLVTIAACGYGLISGKARVFVFGMLWFLIGNLLESTVLPLEIKFEHRTYMPGFGIIFGVVFGLYKLIDLISRSRPISVLLVALLLIPVQVYFLRVHVNAWESHVSLAKFAYERAPNSPRVLVQKANLALNDQNLTEMHRLLDQAQQMKPYEAGYGLLRLSHLCNSKSLIPEELVSRTLKKLETGVPTVLTFNGFGRLIKHCNKREYDDKLRILYQAVAESRRRRLAANGLLMQARVHQRQGDQGRYRNLLEQASMKARTYEVKTELGLTVR